MGKDNIIVLALATGFTLMMASPGTYAGKCPLNMHFSACGSDCPENCAQRGAGITCTAQCVPKCVCNTGYILEGPDSTNCITRALCDSCKDSSYYTTCGTACPLNCQNYKNPPVMCTLQCVRGCFCKEGFIFLNGRKGQCVRPSRCPINRG
ncbi:alpha-tectorin-like [Ambystoma mexicanum]|uniref:alpha-tectorin-like n=1 Tax=Ambystoma mexicanum TaxID=8296 RepID=UPI0037E9B0FF